MSRLSRKVNLMKSMDVNKIPIRRDLLIAGAYVIELPLDSQPDYVWQAFFEQEWKSSLHLWERKIVIAGDKLLLITTPSQIGEKIDWLKSVIDSTNMRVEEFLQTEKIKEKGDTVELLRKHENIIRDELRTKLF